MLSFKIPAGIVLKYLHELNLYAHETLAGVIAVVQNFSQMQTHPTTPTRLLLAGRLSLFPSQHMGLSHCDPSQTSNIRD